MNMDVEVESDDSRFKGEEAEAELLTILSNTNSILSKANKYLCN